MRCVCGAALLADADRCPVCQVWVGTLEHRWHDLQGRIRSGKVKVVSAPRGEVEALKPQVEEVLRALGLRGAYVTDRSDLSDFVDLCGDTPREEWLAQLSAALRIEVEFPCPIVELARRVAKRSGELL